MKFQYRARWGLTADECAYIYTVCQMFYRQDANMQQRINALVTEIGGDSRKALAECLTRHDDQRYVATRHYLDQGVLSRMIKRFYKEYARRYL